MMKDWDSIYMSINTNDNSEMGIMKLNDFSVDGNIQMYAYTTCTNMTTCAMTSMVQSVSAADYIYVATVTQDTYDDKTLTNIHHLDSYGNYHWAVAVELGASSLSDYYEV